MGDGCQRLLGTWPYHKARNLEPYHLADLRWFLQVGKKLSYYLFFSYGRGKIVKALCSLKLKSKILCSVRIS